MRNFSARRPVWMRFFFSPSQRLLGVFLIFILLPALFLGVFALRVLRQEKQLVRQRASESLERKALEIGFKLQSEFISWEEMISQAAESGNPLTTEYLPQVFRQAFEEAGGGVFLFHGEGGFDSFPSRALLYRFGSQGALKPPAIQPTSEIEKAEKLEIKKDYPNAILAYSRLLKTSSTDMRPLLLQRLARTLGKSGRLDEAADVYRQLQELQSIWLGGLPADFIGRTALCDLASERGALSELAHFSLPLYHDLTEGKWLLDKSRYPYYSECCRSWCQESLIQTDEFIRLKKIEESKLSLTRAAENLIAEPGRILSIGTETFLCFWRTDPMASVILSESFLRSQWWPKIVSTGGEDIDAFLCSSDGHILFGSESSEVSPLTVVQDVWIDGTPWRLEVWPKNPEAVQKEVKQRQSLFLAVLIFIGTLLIFGSYITVRIVKRELEISRMRADFVSTVSHEFRSPLTGIRHLGEMLLDNRVTDRTKQRGYYKMIVQESDRLTRLVENILDFSRMEEGRKEFRFRPLRTSAWLRELVKDFKAEIAAEGIDVEAGIPEDLPQISADKEALGSAVHNLLDNAVKYSPGEKTVWITVERKEGEIKIAVRDKGVGISEQDRKYIFDRFYRAKAEISKRVKGAGLGLSLVRYIVEAHSGRVECESSPGEGSTFSIHIPVEPGAEGGVDE
jgi:signal transduction histidine kinase